MFWLESVQSENQLQLLQNNMAKVDIEIICCPGLLLEEPGSILEK